MDSLFRGKNHVLKFCRISPNEGAAGKDGNITTLTNNVKTENKASSQDTAKPSQSIWNTLGFWAWNRRDPLEAPAPIQTQIDGETQPAKSIPRQDETSGKAN